MKELNVFPKECSKKWARKKKVVTKPLIFVGVIAGGPNSRLMNGQIIGGKRSSNDHLEKCRLLRVLYYNTPKCMIMVVCCFYNH